MKTSRNIEMRRKSQALPLVFRSLNSHSMPPLKVIVLGGLEEVGRNMTILEYGNDIIIIDMGLQFPEEDMPGIDYIIPNASYLLPKRKNIRAVFITHAHYDHIGGIPHLIPQLGEKLPIYGTDITCAIIKRRQEDYKHYGTNLNLNVVTNDTKLTLGAFSVEFFGVSHNVPGAVGVIAHTPQGTVIHTGDFKIDLKSDIAGRTEVEKIKALARKNVLAMLSDSTNAREPGHQFSEEDIKVELEDIIRDAKGRLIVGTFSSLLGRLNQIIQLAEKYKKKVAVDGHSMKINIEIGRELGYMKFNPKTLIPLEQVARFPPDRVMVLATGAQGEDRAVLMRLANREHRILQLEPGDTVVFSSSVIPGNERTVQRLTDKLYREGADVINYRMLDIHAGGHAKKEDLKQMIKWVNPKYLIPIEGNHSFLKMHAKAAVEAGFDPKRVLIADNGQVIEARDGVMRLTNERIPANYVFVDGLGVGDIGEVVLRDREALSQDGMFVIIAIIDSQNGKLRGSPDIISRGFIYLRENQELLKEVRKKIKDIIEKSATGTETLNPQYIRDNIRDKIGQYLFAKTQRRPMVLPVVIEV
ncbi:MAG: ribonuclease J [Candidatus Sungbacteria bacterium]|nr:ribonuclease J [Candidatus Sungbacteria bacterium]